MANEVMIPALPCQSINATLAFYVALGFEITYQQARPNTYACVKRGGIEIHFFVMKGIEPKDSYSTCLVMVPDAEKLYQEFAAGLRQNYGKLPTSGIPRLTPVRNPYDNERRFNVIDPGGNWIRFIQLVEQGATIEPANLGKWGRALQTAGQLAYSKGDALAAAKVLDVALAHADGGTPVEWVQALVMRAELAVELDDRPLAEKYLGEVGQTPLNDDERAALVDHLGRADALAKALV